MVNILGAVCVPSEVPYVANPMTETIQPTINRVLVKIIGT